MPSSGPSTSSDLTKLTVPQLRALCKERRITGYSKLAKAALLQRLAEVASPEGTVPSAARASNATAAPSIAPLEGIRGPACVQPSATQRDGNATADNTESTSTSTARVPLHIELPKPPQTRTISSTTNTHKTSGTKRPAHIDISAPLKRVRASLESTAHVGDEPPVSRTSAFQQTLPVDSSLFKIPGLPVQPRGSLRGSTLTPAKQPSDTGKCATLPCQTTGTGPGRFKPLVVSRPKIAEPGKGDKEPLRTPVVPATPRVVHAPLPHNSRATPPPVLSNIDFPPKASERRWVYRWAIILSGLSPGDRQTCRLVSRTFRYAGTEVYLSATHILSKDYPGRRLDSILEQYPKNMTNLWPYLRFRTAEMSERRCEFRQSFLGQYTNSIGYDPLSVGLWASPDDEKQVDIALRFILTRMWFAVSVGAYGHDASKWSKSVIRDVREVVKGEIWQVIAQEDGASGTFYVLEATCEVIGQSPSPEGENILGYCLRADWTAWISQWSQAPIDAGPCSLLECVTWPNTEDYHKGISKAWLRRVQGQDADSISRRNVAKRYILASVVANGVSGKWMSTSAMAQEFAGLPGDDPLVSRPAGRLVNMYLPAHHHVESVHFTTAQGESLHTAVAAVQTPGREYYVFRDNGMQVGCEEEGIPKIWQKIIGCDMLGRALLACTARSAQSVSV